MLTHGKVDLGLGSLRNQMVSAIYDGAKQQLDELEGFAGREQYFVHYPWPAGMEVMPIPTPEETFQFLTDTRGNAHLVVYMAYVSEAPDYRYAVMYLLDTDKLRVFLQVWEKGAAYAYEMNAEQIRRVSHLLDKYEYQTPYYRQNELMSCLFYPTSN